MNLARPETARNLYAKTVKGDLLSAKAAIGTPSPPPQSPEEPQEEVEMGSATRERPNLGKYQKDLKALWDGLPLAVQDDWAREALLANSIPEEANDGDEYVNE